MDGFSFSAKIAELFASLAWPVVALGFLIMFREELRGLIQRIKGVKTSSFELFLAEASQAAEEVKNEEPAARQATSTMLGSDSTFFETLRMSPLTVVISSYTELQELTLSLREFAPQDVLQAKILDVAIITWLGREGLIKQSTVQLYLSLRAGRKAAAHDGHSMSESEALVFRQNCLYMKAVLERVPAKLRERKSSE